MTLRTYRAQLSSRAWSSMGDDGLALIFSEDVWQPLRDIDGPGDSGKEAPVPRRPVLESGRESPCSLKRVPIARAKTLRMKSCDWRTSRVL